MTMAGAESGVTAGIDDHGALLVRVDDGRIERIVSGELEWSIVAVTLILSIACFVLARLEWRRMSTEPA